MRDGRTAKFGAAEIAEGRRVRSRFLRRGSLNLKRNRVLCALQRA
jgi:hypothetical protein